MVKLHVEETHASVVCRTRQGQVQHKEEDSIASNGKPYMNQLEEEGTKDVVHVGFYKKVCISEESSVKKGCIKGKSTRTFSGKRRDSSAFGQHCQTGSCRSYVQTVETVQKISTKENKKYWRTVIFLSVLYMQALCWMKRFFKLASHRLEFFLSKWRFTRQNTCSVINQLPELSGIILLDGIKWKRKHSVCLILIFLVTSGAGSDCPVESVSTLKEVKSCPRNKREHDEAARKMNCSSLVSPECADLQYHCLVNGFSNCTVEVCAEKILVQKGYCAEYNKRGKKIQISSGVKPANPPGEHYYSTEAYKYAQCYENVSSLNPHTMASTTMGTNEPAPTHFPDNSTMSTEGSKSSTEYWIVGGFTLPIVFISILILVFSNKKKSKTKKDHDHIGQEIGRDIEASSDDPLLNDTYNNSIAGTEDKALIENGTGDMTLNGVVDLPNGSGNKENFSDENHT